MKDLYEDGIMKELKDLLHSDIITANGKTFKDNYAKAKCYDDNIIKTLDNPLQHEAGIQPE